ncbi:nuclear GTPase SLIP-GC isoform X1 [Pogoniulus pusillus]|uniref:nuclear GTPase SLIP-GC isoform X1 n=1 Tax=Pogoniulus pusillus TaxID=488313 RepID=UPI0030B97666
MEGGSHRKRGGGAGSPAAAVGKRLCKRGTNPEDGKDEALRDYKQMQNELKNILEQSVEKLLDFLSKPCLPETRKGITYFKNRLTSLKPDILLDPIYVGLFGSTGAGKSSLLNAIIDKNFFLPVSGFAACTSCVVQVNTSHSRLYEAKIYLLTDEEWKDELKNLMALVDVDNDEDDSERNEAVSKISAIYGEEAETKSYEELCRMKPIVSIPSSRCITLRETNDEDLSKKMEPYIRIQSIAAGARGEASTEDGKTSLWPLIKNVEVTVPRLQVVPEDVIFVDIPGMGDFNSKRDAMWKENINKCSIIWVVNSFERIQGHKLHEMLLKEGMKAFQRGMCKDISLVVTKSDQIDLNEYKRESKENEINEHDAILKRNKTVKQEKREMMKKDLERKLPGNSEVLQKADLVYTVSAREYWNGKTLSKEETEIPKLRDYLKMFSMTQKRNILREYVLEALSILSLIQSLRSCQTAQHLGVRTRSWQDFMQKITDLEESIEQCFRHLEKPLSEGLGQAKESYDRNIKKIFNQVRNRQGFHRTLKAVCLKEGVYVSKTFGRIDINGSLAQPIYERIDMTFGNIFRIQMDDSSVLKTCLDKFKDAMKQQLQRAVESAVPDRSNKLEFLYQEVNAIVREIEKIILQRKAEIYNSLTTSIQQDLVPYYKAAAMKTGPQACTRMTESLCNGIMREVEDGMFERAQAKMRQEFQVLKEDITKEVKKDFSDMLDLAFGPPDPFTSELPDLQEQLSSVRAIHQGLHAASEA